jgi:glycosyltransferase involved in cell wall biosynthesis
LRIAVLSWESLYTIQVGGLAVAASMLAEELGRRGHQVSYFTRGAPGQPRQMRINDVDYHTIPVDPMPSSYSLSLNMSDVMVEGVRAVERVAGRFDVVHGHDWLVVDALQELGEHGVPIVMTYHSTEYGRNGGRLGDWWGFRDISDRERYVGQIADRVTTVSECMRRELNWLYDIPAGKISVIPNGTVPGRYSAPVDPGACKRRLGIHPFAPVILFVGRMEYQKGPDLLLDAIPAVLEERPDAVFLFVGQGSMRDHLERRAHEMGVAGSARFLGFLPHWEYVEILNACDLVCIPSRNEPFGMVLLEAWAAGKVVVASDVGGLGENIDHMVNGMKVNPDAGSISWGIGGCLRDTQVREKMADGGSQKVQQFGWDRSVAMLLDVYRAAMGDR